MDADVIVVGGGIVGSALAYGIARNNKKVLVLDGADYDFRAARANFGLVWVQGKGANQPDYSAFTRESVDRWPSFSNQLAACSGFSTRYVRSGGLSFCLGNEELEQRHALLNEMRKCGNAQDAKMLGRAELMHLHPSVALGSQVVGASFCRHDGHVNPLRLLASLHKAIFTLGGHIVYHSKVEKIEPTSGGFSVLSQTGVQCADRVVVAAGAMTNELTRPLGLVLPMRTERGQILVTERVAPMLPFPASGIRQTSEGTIMIGATHEDVGYNTNVTVAAATRLACRATAIVPRLATLRLIRQWSGLRILSPDKGPVYDQAIDYPGLFATFCHSGVTLAAIHADVVGPALANGALPDPVEPFNGGRFNAKKCA